MSAEIETEHKMSDWILFSITFSAYFISAWIFFYRSDMPCFWMWYPDIDDEAFHSIPFHSTNQ